MPTIMQPKEFTVDLNHRCACAMGTVKHEIERNAKRHAQEMREASAAWEREHNQENWGRYIHDSVHGSGGWTDSQQTTTLQGGGGGAPMWKTQLQCQQSFDAWAFMHNHLITGARPTSATPQALI